MLWVDLGMVSNKKKKPKAFNNSNQTEYLNFKKWHQIKIVVLHPEKNQKKIKVD